MINLDFTYDLISYGLVKEVTHLYLAFFKKAKY